MIMINSNCTFPIDKVIEVCKIAYENLHAKRNEKINSWFDNQKKKHFQKHNKKWFKSEYKDPTDEDLILCANSHEADQLSRAQNFHRDDGIIICTIHEAAVFAKQHGIPTMQVDANSLYAIHFWYDKLADKK